jgi:hypothetical protein
MTEIIESYESERDSAAIRVVDTTGQSRAHWTQSRVFIVHVSGEETHGRLSLVEGLLPPDAMTPLHVLPHASQILYVLEGELTAAARRLPRPSPRRVYEPAGGGSADSPCHVGRAGAGTGHHLACRVRAVRRRGRPAGRESDAPAA